MMADSKRIRIITDKGNSQLFNSVNDCEATLRICSKTIRRYIDTGINYRGMLFSSETVQPVEIKPIPTRQPRILFIDIETSLLKVLTFRIHKQHIGYNQIEQDKFILCWAAKWLHEYKLLGDSVTSKEAIRADDRRIVQSIYELINTADIIIAHNGERFDLPIIKTRMLVHRIPPINPYNFVDTYKVAKKEFGHTSNALNFINQTLGIKEKTETRFELWKECLYGNKKSLKKMADYCKNDVAILQENYLIVRPYIHSHPNLNLLYNDNEERCPNCGSTKIKFDGNFYNTMVSSFSTFRCECGYVGRIRTTALSKEKRNHLVTLVRHG